jgi:hypothetical protein
MKLLNPAFRVMGSHEKRYYQAESHAFANDTGVKRADPPAGGEG